MPMYAPTKAIDKAINDEQLLFCTLSHIGIQIPTDNAQIHTRCGLTKPRTAEAIRIIPTVMSVSSQ